MYTIQTDQGVIDITKDVFMNIVGDAASGCFGVKGMAGRKEGGWMLLHRDSMSRGVDVSLSEDGDAVAVQLHIVVEHGVNLSALCASIAGEVGYKVTKTTGVRVSTIDIFIDQMTMD